MGFESLRARFTLVFDSISNFILRSLPRPLSHSKNLVYGLKMLATRRGWQILLGAIFVGIALGATARLWMRWISTQPEFSWSGSIFIVIAFTIFTTSQAIVYVLRRSVKSKRLTTVVRSGGAILSLSIFGGAGALMFPTVFLASIGLWQKRLDRRIRHFLLAVSLLIPTRQIMDFGTDFGWNLATLGRSLLFVLIYSIVTLLLKPTVTPYSDQ